MVYQSLLFDQPDQLKIRATKEAPGYLVDLNLDQVFADITDHKESYNLLPFYYSPLSSKNRITQRQQVFRDLEDEPLLDQMRLFTADLNQMRAYLGLADKVSYQHYRQGWFLEAAILYFDAVERLTRYLSSVNIKSSSLMHFRCYLTEYTQSQDFITLATETHALKAELAEVIYSVTIQGLYVQVRKYNEEIDYTNEVTRLFEKFKQGAARDYKFNIPDRSGTNHVGARILDFVARFYPDAFTRLRNYCEESSQFIDEGIQTFDREIQFFLAYLEYIAKLKEAGLEFCYPQISEQRKDVYLNNGFDIALAARNVPFRKPLVCNDFYLKGPERVFVISGPNQGGKTTFARMFGQLHYLASLGCPVPGKESRLFLFDQLFTHFEKEEDVTNLRGKLQYDLIRIRQILDRATPSSIVILNEIFTSTTLQDAVYLSKQIMEKLLELDLLGVCVTFIDELSSMSEKTVSMVSTVDPENPALRTYKIIRKTADGLSYAIEIAEKHGLTYSVLKGRVKP